MALGYQYAGENTGLHTIYVCGCFEVICGSIFSIFYVQWHLQAVLVFLASISMVGLGSQKVNLNVKWK
jgi:hypothetical protein